MYAHVYVYVYAHQLDWMYFSCMCVFMHVYMYVYGMPCIKEWNWENKGNRLIFKLRRDLRSVVPDSFAAYIGLMCMHACTSIYMYE
jgi:hypothetical protein